MRSPCGTSTEAALHGSRRALTEIKITTGTEGLFCTYIGAGNGSRVMCAVPECDWMREVPLSGAPHTGADKARDLWEAHRDRAHGVRYLTRWFRAT